MICWTTFIFSSFLRFAVFVLSFINTSISVADYCCLIYACWANLYSLIVLYHYYPCISFCFSFYASSLVCLKLRYFGVSI